MKRACIGILIAAALCGQGSISGPANEYIFDAGTGSIRAIVGAPGSAYLGKSVTAGVQFGSVAPNGLSAIIVTGSAAGLIADLTQSTTPLPLPGAIESPDQILWAVDSSSAVLFSSRTRSLQFVAQINGQPDVQARIDLAALQTLDAEPAGDKASSRAPGNHASANQIVLLAIDPAAQLAVIGVGGRGQSDVYLLQSGMAPRLLMNLQSASAAAFAADGSLYVVDASAGQVYAVRNPSQNAAIQSLPAPPGGLGQPVAIAIQGNLLYIADSVANRIRVYDPATLQKIDDLELDSTPSTLEQFTATSFLVNARRQPADPVLLLQTSPIPSVIFIPSGGNQ